MESIKYLVEWPHQSKFSYNWEGVEKRAVKLVMHDQLALIILAAKWKIYVNNQLGQGTCLYQILYAIHYMIEILKLIAARRKRVVNHNELWGEIENDLT